MKNFIITLLLTAFFATLSILAQAQVEITPNFSTSDQVDTVLPPPLIDTIPSPPPPIYSYDSTAARLVIWLHGLAGSDQSWKTVAALTYNNSNALYPSRIITKSNPDYSEEQTVTVPLALPDIHRLINQGITPNNIQYDTGHSVVIAHSMGGIIARGLRHAASLNPDLPAQFEAIASYGTPYGGAKIINNSAHEGYADEWIEDGCNKLGVAEISASVVDNWLLDILASRATIVDFMATACAFLAGTPLDYLMDAIRKPATADIKHGAPYINTLHNFQDPIPTVVFYGVEEEPVLWRTLFSMVQHDSTLASNGFAATEDQLGVDEMNAEIDKLARLAWRCKKQMIRYDNMYHAVTVKSWALLAIDPLNSVRSFLTADNARSASESWRDHMYSFNEGMTWLRYANLNWKRIIGARYDSTYQAGFMCRCIDETTPGLNVTWSLVNSPSECNSNGTSICQAFPHFEKKSFTIPNDGVVTVRSATNINDALKFELIGSNHLQMRNDINARRTLNGLFDGTYHPYFKTKQR